VTFFFLNLNLFICLFELSVMSFFLDLCKSIMILLIITIFSFKTFFCDKDIFFTS